MSARWNNRSSDESFSMSKTPPVTIDSRGANGAKKVKRVNVESGYKRRSFKLSFIFLLLQLVSAMLSYFIVAKDFMIATWGEALVRDIRSFHDAILLFQFDQFAFEVRLAHPEPREPADSCAQKPVPDKTAERAAADPRVLGPEHRAGLRQRRVPEFEREDPIPGHLQRDPERKSA